MTWRRLLIPTLITFVVAGSCDDRKEPRTERAPRSSDVESITVVSYGGGAYQQSHIDAFFRPFSERDGTIIEPVVWGAEYGRLSEMVSSRRVPWDVVEVTAAQYARGVRDSLFERLSEQVPDSEFRPISGAPGPQPFGVPNVYWSTVLAYQPRAFPKQSPSTWQDFWDVQRFPGPRALYDDPRGNLEFALIADGVAPGNLYPLDVERAFRKLDQIKPHIRVWWNDGTEPVRLLLTQQVALTSAWSGRIFASPQARDTLGYSWSGAAHELDYWVIPRGSRNVERANRFIRFASQPGPMARQAELTAYGPANTLALAAVDSSVLPHLPTAETNWAVSFVINSEWWALHEEELQGRWLQWKNR